MTVSPAVAYLVNITVVHIPGSLLPGMDSQALPWSLGTVLLSVQRWELYLAFEGGLVR